MKNIPHVAHLCWFGHHPMPLLNVFTVVSFHKHNPDWKIKVYYSKQTMKDFGSREWLPPYQGQDYFDMLFGMDFLEMIEIDLLQTVCPTKSHIVCASDVFRQDILFREGGLYSDFDVIWLRPMSYFEKLDVIGDPTDFQCTVSFYQNTHGFHNVSNIIAEKGSKFLSDLLHVSKKVRPPFSHQAYGTDLWNKYFPTLESINDRYERMCALKYETFFPSTLSSWRSCTSKTTSNRPMEKIPWAFTGLVQTRSRIITSTPA